MSVNLTSKMIGEVHHPLAYWTCPTTGLFITNENESETCWCSTSTSLKNAKVFPAFSPIFWRVSRKNLGIYCTTLGCPRSHYYMYEMSEAILKVGKVASAALRAETLRSFSRRMQKQSSKTVKLWCCDVFVWLQKIHWDSHHGGGQLREECCHVRRYWRAQAHCR